MNNALTVTELNSYIKALMDSDDFLSGVAIRGEISNFKLHTSGHIYFTLKDATSEISAVMFRAAASRLGFTPRVGSLVTAYGSVSVFEKTGKYQLYVNAMTNDGRGALYEQYTRLLEKLRSEGLFDADRKRKIPRFPRRIGIVTSPTGAAVRDMINVTGRRFPSAEILLSPALVQGEGAPEDLCRALGVLDALGECDVIIIGRGGGSIEDLWAFNDEALVRMVANTSTPIISAVGHETDTTLCDYAADMRAPTPSAAAEQAVPDATAILQGLDQKLLGMERTLGSRLEAVRRNIAHGARSIEALSPESKILSMKKEIRSHSAAIDAAIASKLKHRKTHFSGAVARLEAVNPLSILSRGYSMALDGNGAVVSSTSNVALGDKISVIVSDGVISARVEDTKEA